MQYFNYCTVCNFFNSNHSIDLILKNWIAQSDTLAIRVTLLFLCSFNFSSLSSSRLPLFKNIRNSPCLSLFQPNMPQNLSLMPQKKATSDALVTSPPKNECEPTMFQLPTQMWLDLVIKFMEKKISLPKIIPLFHL